MKNGRREGCNDGGDPESKPGESRVHANAKDPNFKRNFVIGLIILMLNCKQNFLKSVDSGKSDCMSAPWPLVGQNFHILLGCCPVVCSGTSS